MSYRKESYFIMMSKIVCNYKDVDYEINIRDCDRSNFWAQQIACVKAYAKAHDIEDHSSMLKRAVQPVPYLSLNVADKVVLRLWSMAFADQSDITVIEEVAEIV